MPMADRAFAGELSAASADCCALATLQIMWQSFEYLTCVPMVRLYVGDIETGRMAT